MENNLNRLNVVSIKAAFVDASIYKICNSLISYSVDILDEEILAKIIVLDTISPADEDGVMDILGDVMGHFPGARANFQLLKVDGGQPVLDSEALTIKLFRRAS